MFPLDFINPGNAYMMPSSSSASSEGGNTLTHMASAIALLTAATTSSTIPKITSSSSYSTSSGSSSLSAAGSLADNVTRIALLGNDGLANDSSSGFVPSIQRPETIFVAILFMLIFIVGVLGNGTLVIIFFRHRSMRNIPNT